MKQGYRQSVGKRGEEKAAQFLEQRGYKILERNFRFNRGEIDIIAKQNDEIVFIEVKTKLRDDFGEPEDMVGSAKQRKIAYVAMGYLQSKGLYDVDCRFDVISVTGQDYTIRHIKDAFWLDSLNINF